MTSRFLFKGNPLKQRGQHSVQVADELSIVHSLRLKAKPDQSPHAFSTELVADGRDRSRLDFRLRRGSTGRGKDIDSKNRYYAIKVPATAAETKKVIRQLRPQEEREIEVFDELIRRNRAALHHLEESREEKVREAWSKGHTVQVKTLLEMAKEATPNA